MTDEKNIIAVFQPHRFTRFHGLWSEFLTSFEYADKVFITDVYAASEAPIEGVNSQEFAEKLSETIPCVQLKGSIANVAEQLLPRLKQDDVVIGLGAGTITTLGKDLLAIKEGAKV